MIRGIGVARGMMLAALVLAAAGLTGCGKSEEGRYVMTGGVATIELKGGKATLTTTLGGTETVTADYVREGDTIKVKAKEGEMVFTITKDGSLEGMLGTFKKTAG